MTTTTTTLAELPAYTGKGGYQLTVAAVIEREGGDKPVCIAEPVFRFLG